MKIVKAIRLNDADSCALPTEAVNEGDCIAFNEGGCEKRIAAREYIPRWHKIAICPINAGDNIYKYGAVIGVAIRDIAAGEHVHTHNMHSPQAGGQT